MKIVWQNNFPVDTPSEVPALLWNTRTVRKSSCSIFSSLYSGPYLYTTEHGYG